MITSSWYIIKNLDRDIMITIEWNLIVYILIMLFGLLYLIFGKEESSNYISIPLIKPVVFVCMVVYTVIWGGIFWW